MATRRPRRPDPATWPHGPVTIDTGTAELIRSADHPDIVTLMVNGVPSSSLHLGDPTQLEFEYQQHMSALIGELPVGPLRVVHLGAGGCGLALAIRAHRPGSHQVAIEIDATLVEYVRTWFDLPRPPELRLRATEARQWLEHARPGLADVIIRDAFSGDQVPEPLVTVEAARAVARSLTKDGLYLANCADQPPLSRARAEAATLATVFDHLAIVAETGVLRGRRRGNVVLVASAVPLGHLTQARHLRSGPVPARVLVDDDATAFTAGAAVLTDRV